MLEIREVRHLEDGRSIVDTVGGRRFRVKEQGMRDGYNTAKVQFIQDIRVEGKQSVFRHICDPCTYYSTHVSILSRKDGSEVRMKIVSIVSLCFKKCFFLQITLKLCMDININIPNLVAFCFVIIWKKSNRDEGPSGKNGDCPTTTTPPAILRHGVEILATSE